MGNLNDPGQLSWLPFPVAGDYAIPERFTVTNKRFPALGRKGLNKLEQEVSNFLRYEDTGTAVFTPPTTINTGHLQLRRFLIYGNVGAGKSHLIMMLALRLRKKFLAETPVKWRVVIVASAGYLVGLGAFEYLLTAVKLACADDQQDLHDLECIQNEQQLRTFCQQLEQHFVFVVDQADIFEHSHGQVGDISIVAANASEARDLLNAVVGARNFVIYGASANNETAKQRFKKQQDITFYDIFGGFEYEEMEQWLLRSEIKLSAEQKDKLFDDTGAVPLFLTWFRIEPKTPLPRDYTNDDNMFKCDWSLFIQCRPLVNAIAQVDKWVASSVTNQGFEDLANAILTQSNLPVGADFSSYDNRYHQIHVHL